MKFDPNQIANAAQVIAGAADNTPFVPSPFLSEFSGQEVLLKLENMQPIGAFKLRGAMNAVMNLGPAAKGVTCCSTGNHGRGVAYAAAKRGLRAVICMSSLVPETKVNGIKALGAEVRICGTSQDDAEALSRQLAEEDGLVEISPFDDADVIAGQGTIGREMVQARPDLSMIVTPLSGGGLAGGVAVAAKMLNPKIGVVGVTMDRGAAMHLSLSAGQPVEVEEVVSLADSLGGGIGADNLLSLPLCQEYLDESILVSEEEIRDAMQVIYFEDRMVAEGSSVVGIAALLTGKLNTRPGPIGIIVTGRNVDMKLHQKLMAGEDVKLGDRLLKGKTYSRPTRPK